MTRQESSPFEVMVEHADKLYSMGQVTQAIQEIAKQISDELSEKDPIVLVCMMGGLVPAGWLLPLLQFPMKLDYLQITRYRGTTEGGDLEWIKKPALDMREQTVLIVDDIFDEGVTLAEIQRYCTQQGAQEIKTAVLVEKNSKRKVDNVVVDYVGLHVPDRYVFGFGMDYQHYWRNASGIYALKEQ